MLTAAGYISTVKCDSWDGLICEVGADIYMKGLIYEKLRFWQC